MIGWRFKSVFSLIEAIRFIVQSISYEVRLCYIISKIYINSF